jgi:hypothetical protein
LLRRPSWDILLFIFVDDRCTQPSWRLAATWALAISGRQHHHFQGDASGWTALNKTVAGGRHEGIEILLRRRADQMIPSDRRA